MLPNTTTPINSHQQQENNMKKRLLFFIIFIILFATCGEPIENDTQPPPDRVVTTDILLPVTTIRSNSYQLKGYSVSSQANIKAVYFSLSTNNYNLVTFNSNLQNTEWSTNITFLGNGTYTLNAYTVDFNNNYSLTNKKTLIVDTSPVITVDYPFDNQTIISTNFFIRGSVIDYDNNITNLSYVLDNATPIQIGSGWGNESAWSNELTLPQTNINGNNHSLTIYAIDSDNNHSSNTILFSVNTNAFIFDIAIDGIKDDIYSNAQFFNDPDDDELEGDAFREITGVYVTNDINYLYLAIGLKNLTNTLDVDLGFMIDLDNQQDVGGTGYNYSKTIECHTNNLVHLSDLQIYTDLSNTFGVKKWSPVNQEWQLIAITTNDYAYSTNFFELRIKLVLLDVENNQPIFIRAFSTGRGVTPAFDVAPADDKGSYPEATTNATSYIFNPGNDAGEYKIVR